MDDLKLIKKYFGEPMMHLCRELFPTILDSGILFCMLKQKLYPSKTLYEDIINENKVYDFKNFIYNTIKNNKDIKLTNKTPEELLKSIGYTLYEVNTYEELMSFKKYYAKGEDLCSFRVKDRLDKAYVYFAIKDNLESIKRSEIPQRQDEYGTSVISIQFTKDEAKDLSIKNRYNDAVPNADATYSNDLDNIVPGLTSSFAKFKGMEQKRVNNNFTLNSYTTDINGVYYKYNIKINDIYYCTDNIIIDNLKVKKYDKDYYLIFDNYILDMKNKKIDNYTNNNSFIESIGKIKDIKILTTNDSKVIKLINIDNNVSYIILDKNNRIIAFINNYVKDIKDNFLSFSKYIKYISLNNALSIGNSFLEFNDDLESYDLSNVESIGNNFLLFNNKVNVFDFNNLLYIGDNCLKHNKKVSKIYSPRTKIIGNNFFFANEVIDSVNLNDVEYIGDNCMSANKRIKVIYLPNCLHIGDRFLFYNKVLNEFSIKYIDVGSYFLHSDEVLEYINSDKLIGYGYHTLDNNKYFNGEIFEFP